VKGRRTAHVAAIDMTVKLAEEKNLAGCCGLYCGLCPRYQSTAKSRCEGCRVISLAISCKIYNCCVKKNAFVTCADCSDWPCEKLDGFFDGDSFISHKVCRPNTERIKEVGLKAWLQEQTQRKSVLEDLLANYNEGRSCSFFCIATALMPVDLVKRAENQAKTKIADEKIQADIKAKAKVMRSVIQDLASEAGIDLKLRKKRK
jgi:hypothetical protein